MAKKPFPKKTTAPEQENEKQDKGFLKVANTKIEDSLKDFSKLSEKERKDLGSDEFFEQFWLFFKDQHPDLLHEIGTKENLTIYIKNLEKSGFSLENIIKNNQELHKEFKETQNEKDTIETSLKQLKDYCEKPENKLPANLFDNFAKEINLKTAPNIEITKATKLNKIGNLYHVWKAYLENNGIKLKDHQKDKTTEIMNPKYLPTERLLISASIKKIKKNLPAKLISDFDTSFPLPIDIHSSFESLKDFKQQRILFLEAHKGDIDEKLAKDLDKIIITNADIYKEFEFEGESIERNKGFSEQTKNFRNMFNKLVTRQIFDKAKETGSYIEGYFTQIGKEFREFPPYFNELFNIYPYKHKEVIENQPEHKTAYEKQEKILQEKEELLNSPQPENEKSKSIEQRRNECYQAVIKAKDELNTIKRNAYASYISKKEPKIGGLVDKLVQNKFDMSKLSTEDQQKIIDTLINNKLEDSIKNQIPNIMGLDSKEYQTFIKNLFDLNQKDIIIPTQYGKIPLHFLEKKFVGGPTKENMEISSSGNLITEQKNLPLNFKVQITEQNRDFFENNLIFDDLFTEFNAKNTPKPIKLNDSYKVSIKREDGIKVEGYLSQYPPSEDIQEEIEGNKLEKGRFLYSHPITRPEDARSVVTRDNKPEGNPVVIPEKNEKLYEIDILSKELNLNDEAIGGLLFAHTLGQYTDIKKDLDPKQEKKLAEKFGKIESETLYHDTNDMIDNPDKKDPEKKEETIEDLMQKDYEECIEGRKSLKGYQEKNDKEKSHGFKEGAKLLIEGPDSGFLPTGTHQYMTGEIIKIDKKKGIFKVRFTGNEQTLGKYEGTDRIFSLSKNGIEKFKNIFEENKIYKLPNEETTNDINKTIANLEENKVNDIDPDRSFKEVRRNGNNFVIDTGKEKNKEVTHFGLIETAPGEDMNKESKVGYMYKIDHEPDKKGFKITANDQEKTTIHLDYPNFILFVAGKKLQPKTDEGAKGIEIPDNGGPKTEKQKKRKGYSISNVLGLFKNFSKKIGDGLKKYEEEQTEELTEAMFYQGKLFGKLAGIMPTNKLKTAFGNAALEYMAERDNKIWKKIEKYQKFYESDPDFGGDYMRGENVKPYLEGKKPFKDHHQPAAMLLATINKGKGPYSRNTDRAGKGMWVRILFGVEHQKRYLLMKEKLQRELDQGYNVYGQIWADDLQNEILKLEMKYITHCIDGRQLADRGDVARLEGMFSKKYAGELEGAAGKFFSESVSSSSKEKGYSFELARFEYFRLLGDRPQQAIPCLKQIAAKAVTPTQRKIFESAVLTGMLSGVFYNITQEDKSFIQKICRTIGFLPGMWIRHPNHHEKVAQFIKIATGENPQYQFEEGKDNRKRKQYKAENHGFGKGPSIKDFKLSTGYDHGINLWLTEGNRLQKIGEFAAMVGKNYEGKTIIELINDPKTPAKTKQLLKEIEVRSLEKDESVDGDVKMNGYGLEQNILAKNQSLIDEITDFSDGKFRGKDKDEIQGMQATRKEVAKKIPRKYLEDKNQVIYLLKKFMNRFEGRGFNTEEKRFLIRTLLTIKSEIAQGNTESADEMLRYIIVGNVVRNSGNGQAPDELIAGLEAFKDFFKSNLNTILQKDVIAQGLENELFVEELDKGPYKVAPWEEYADLEENKVFFGTKDENRKRSENRKKYNVEQLYINRKLYTSAKQIEQRNHIPNKFKNHLNLQKVKTTSEKLHETLNKKDIRIKNPEIIEKVKRKLSSQLSQDDMSDEDLAAAMNAEDGYGDFY